MEIVRGEELPDRYQELIERAASDERIVLSFAGQQVALVSFDDLALLDELDREQDQQDLEEYRRMKADPSQIPMRFVPSERKEQAVHG